MKLTMIFTVINKVGTLSKLFAEELDDMVIRRQVKITQNTILL